MGTRHWPDDADEYVEELEQQLAKANERVALLERVEKIFNESPELTFENAKSMFSDELNKFAIENQIKGVDGIKANCNLYKAFPTDKMIARECITVEEVDSYHWYLKKQLRKEQEW